MLKSLVARYEHGHETLDVRCDQHAQGWTVYLKHSRLGRGHSSFHRNPHSARRTWEKLDSEVVALGWRLQTVDKALDKIPQMRIVDSVRLFLDYWTGKWREDDSAWRPAGVSVGVGIPFPVQGEDAPDAFGIDTLPWPNKKRRP